MKVAFTDFVFENREIPVTISMGVAQMPKGRGDTQHFIQLADDELYNDLRSMLNRADEALGSIDDSGPITAVWMER